MAKKLLSSSGLHDLMMLSNGLSDLDGINGLADVDEEATVVLDQILRGNSVALEVINEGLQVADEVLSHGVVGNLVLLVQGVVIVVGVVEEAGVISAGVVRAGVIRILLTTKAGERNTSELPAWVVEARVVREVRARVVVRLVGELSSKMIRLNKLGVLKTRHEGLADVGKCTNRLLAQNVASVKVAQLASVSLVSSYKWVWDLPLTILEGKLTSCSYWPEALMTIHEWIVRRHSPLALSVVIFVVILVIVFRTRERHER